MPTIQKGKMMNEQTLLTAPEADYMNAAQLAFFKELLLKQRADFEENLHSSPATEAEHAADPVDRASREEERQSELSARERDMKTIRQIDEALASIDSGDYGYCQDTGEPIGLKRLLAQPTAQLSVEAKERRERQSRQYGTQHSLAA